jgi:abequosyltransferase
MTKKPLLCIAIPAFNRPQEIVHLLDSIDEFSDSISVLVCEDDSPRRSEIRHSVLSFKSQSTLNITYLENHCNLGYDANLRNLLSKSNGIYTMFMGDDDLFIAGELNRYISFLSSNLHCKYILRSYKGLINRDRHLTESFSYLPRTTYFSSGQSSVSFHFRRSVTITGFTIDTECANHFATDSLDGSLLYQVYVMCMTCLSFPSVYYARPFAYAVQSFRLDNPNFGASKSETAKYTPGCITPQNSLNFTASYFELTEYLDSHNYTASLTANIRVELSKYSYPFLSIQRKRGARVFLSYCRDLENKFHLNCTLYYYVYKYSLLILKESLCDSIIRLIKRFLAFTPCF